MIIISKISPPPISEKNCDEHDRVREIITSNFPADLLSQSMNVLVDSNRDDMEIDDIYDDVKKVILSSIGQSNIVSYIERYQSFIENKIDENKDISLKGKDTQVLYFGLSYILKTNRDLEPDEDGVEPTDDEIYRSYCSPLVPIDSTFLECIVKKELPSDIRLFLEDILVFRKSVVQESESYLEDVNYDEFSSVYLSQAERNMLGIKIA